MLKKIILILWFLCFAIFNLYAQKKIITEAKADIIEYTNKDGLPTTNISNIIETKDGYLWISSIEGTYRFNGYEFEEVGKEYGVPESQAIYYDSTNDRMYFASPYNFIIFDGEKFQSYGNKDGYKINGLDGQVITFIDADSKGRIWIGSSTPYIDKKNNGALTKYEDGKFTAYDSTNFPLHNASGFVETPYGDLIFSSFGRNTRSFQEAYIALYKDDKFKRIDESKGINLVNALLIPQNIIRSIDDKGNTWIAMGGRLNMGDNISISTSGILMYDGTEFHKYPELNKHLNSLCGISSVYYSQLQNKVYATIQYPNSILFSSNNSTILEFNGKEWIKSDIIKNIGEIKYLNSNKSLTDFHYLTPLFTKSNNYFPELLTLRVTDSRIGGQSTIYANQYFTKVNDNWEKIDAFNGMVDKELEQGLLVYTPAGFGIYNHKDYQLFEKKDGFLMPESFIPTLYTDKNGLVWISYSMADLPSFIGINKVGINVWDGKNLRVFKEEDGISSNASFMTYHDSKNQIWITTNKGVTLCREIQNSKGKWIFKFTKIPGNRSNEYNTTKIIETSTGNIFAWQSAVGVSDENRISRFYLGKFDGNKFIEISSPFKKELKNKRYQFIDLIEGIENQLILSGIFSDNNSDLQVERTYLMTYDGNKWLSAPSSWDVPDKQLHYVGKLDKKIYYLTVDGFYSFDGQKFKNLIDSVSATADFRILKGASVAGTKTDNQTDGKLFIRLRDRGLVIFDGTNLKFYTKKDGLPSANLYNPTPDNHGAMCFSHPSGALIIKDDKFQTFYDDDNNLSGGANVTTLDGRGNIVMHYGGIGLLVKQHEQKSFQLKLSSIKINDSTYFYDFPLKFSYSENSLIFNFAALNLKDPKQTTYEYMLEGFDKEWSRPGNLSFAQYQNLPPGKYNFRIKGVTSNGVLTNEVTHAFIINPPYWKTWWAYAFYIGIIFLFLYTIRKVELRRQLKNAKIKESQLRAENAEAQNKLVQAENERKSKELEEARKLQLSMLPKELPQLPNLDIAVYMKTATEVGGDYYDFHVHLDGTLTVLLGDATGHGMQSGMMVSIMKSLFMSDRSNKELKPFFQNTSASIKDMQLGRLMMALTCVQFNSNKIRIANAGMPSTFIYRDNLKKVDEVAINNLPLGAIKDFEYEVKEESISKGDTLLLMSDGFAELKNSDDEMIGYRRTRDIFETVAVQSPEEIIETLKSKIEEWRNGRENEDDITFIVIKVK